jgi:tRNA dimethylallyltransferase
MMVMSKTKPKIIVVLGPTATGKSDLAVDIALAHNGEVISADSRQVYTGLDIGSGKITKKEMRGVPHHMLDVLSPKKIFSVADWQKQTQKIITDILSRGKLPIICGGTGYYVQSIVENIVLPEVPLNQTLRNKLESKSTDELINILSGLDTGRAESIDSKNRVRLIRAIEIATHLGTVPPIQKSKPTYDFLQIGLTLPDEILKHRITARLAKRMREGMLAEARTLHDTGLSWKRMHTLGLEYRYEALLLQNKISKPEFMEQLTTEIWHYAKRQMTWFKRDKQIQWFHPEETADIEKVVAGFLFD